MSTTLTCICMVSTCHASGTSVNHLSWEHVQSWFLYSWIWHLFWYCFLIQTSHCQQDLCSTYGSSRLCWDAPIFSYLLLWAFSELGEKARRGMSAFSTFFIVCAFFYCCSITVVPIFSPLLSPILPTLSHSQFPNCPSSCVLLYVPWLDLSSSFPQLPPSPSPLALSCSLFSYLWLYFALLFVFSTEDSLFPKYCLELMTVRKKLSGL